MSSAASSSNFNVALPYGLATVSMGVAGATIALVATSTVGTVFGIALAFFGVYGFVGVICCGLESKNPEQFQDNIGKALLISGATALSQIVHTVAQVVLIELIASCLEGKRRH